MNNHPMIYVHDICKSYHGMKVLDNLTLSIPQSKTLVILGRSGVGKSVLLKQIIGIEKPDSGYIEVNGISVTSLKRKELFKIMRHFGMLFQGAALFDSMTIGDNVGFYLDQHGDPKTGHKLPKSVRDDQVASALRKVGLENFQTKTPSQLSGGQKKRAALARMIVYQPKILLYDEPTTGLDPITAMQINELILSIQEEMHTTSIVVTHDIRSALEVGDYFALQHRGKIAHFDSKEHFLDIDDPLILNFFENAALPKRYFEQLKRPQVK